MTVKEAKLPKTTYIPAIISEARHNWYVRKKKKELDQLDVETKAPLSFTIPNAATFVKFLSGLVGPKGINIYFATKNKGKPDITLLFAKIAEEHEVIGDFHQLDDTGAFRAIAKDEATRLRANYKDGIKTTLDKTVNPQDLQDNKGETEYIYFSNDRITEILEEIEHQVAGDKITGIRIWIVSYADWETELIFARGNEFKYVQRLSIQFGYLNGREDTSFAEIDPERHRATVTAPSFVPSGFNTGFPVPPYSDEEDGPSDPNDPNQ